MSRGEAEVADVVFITVITTSPYRVSFAGDEVLVASLTGQATSF